LEDLLLTHPAVARVAVIGVPDAAVGESVCAVVVPGWVRADLGGRSTEGLAESALGS
ncbi:hypothetical protein HQO69_23190, partial [Rhodococcus fascians]|nr:hypothetical protein [Rhodococcus fascians]